MTGLLVDSDAFCKLGVAGLLEPLLAELGAELAECRRLPALPHMLRRGALPKKYGKEACERLLPIAEAMAVVPSGSAEWLDRLTGVPQVDVGEALLLACVAEHSVRLVTGDKRALVAVAKVEPFPSALSGKIICLEAALLLLCERLGDERVRAAAQPLISAQDMLAKVCFSPGNKQPQDALRSYRDGLGRDIQPIRLWDPGPPPSGGP